jgi:hypothetical protein
MKGRSRRVKDSQAAMSWKARRTKFKSYDGN